MKNTLQQFCTKANTIINDGRFWCEPNKKPHHHQRRVNFHHPRWSPARAGRHGGDRGSARRLPMDFWRGFGRYFLMFTCGADPSWRWFDRILHHILEYGKFVETSPKASRIQRFYSHRYESRLPSIESVQQSNTWSCSGPSSCVFGHQLTWLVPLLVGFIWMVGHTFQNVTQFLLTQWVIVSTKPIRIIPIFASKYAHFCLWTQYSGNTCRRDGSFPFLKNHHQSSSIIIDHFQSSYILI